MTTVEVGSDGRYTGLPEVGQPIPCPRAALGRSCGAHTRLRFTWPTESVHRLADLDGPRVLVVAKNPSCPDTATNSTLAPVLDRTRRLAASAVAVVNILPTRLTDPRDLRVSDLDPEILAANRRVIAGLVAWADIVIAAWGHTPPTQAAARPMLTAELRRARQLLSGHSDVQQIGDEYHPSYWNRRRDLTLRPWHA